MRYAHLAPTVERDAVRMLDRVGRVGVTDGVTTDGRDAETAPQGVLRGRSSVEAPGVEPARERGWEAEFVGFRVVGPVSTDVDRCRPTTRG